MRAVIHTSVLVSGILSRRSYPAKVLDAWVLGQFTPIVSRELVKEYASVLVRNKFAVLGPAAERINLLEKILTLPWVIMVYPQENVSAVPEDPDDNKVLECAIEGMAKWVVTGDKHLLNLSFFEDIAIVTAERFVETIKPTSDKF